MAGATVADCDTGGVTQWILGGWAQVVSKKQAIDQIYTSIAEELRNQYSLGYTPGSDVASGYHKIHLTTKQKDMTVQTRDGYYSDR